MEMFDQKVIEFNGRPLFQTAKVRAPSINLGQLEDVACFFYVVKGAIKTIDQNGAVETKRSDALLKSCGNFISSYMNDEDGSPFEAAVIYFYPDFLKEIYKNELPPFAMENAKAMPPQRYVANDLIHKFMEGMFIYFENEALMDEELAKLKIKELVMILLRSQYFEGVISFFQGLFAPKNASFREIVENNLYNHLSIEQLAFLCHQSLSTFKRTFKSEFGESPARYIKERRLQKAAQKILASNDAFSTIAYDCGFQDPSTFSALFSQRFGKSPRQYRLDHFGKSSG